MNDHAQLHDASQVTMQLIMMTLSRNGGSTQGVQHPVYYRHYLLDAGSALGVTDCWEELIHSVQYNSTGHGWSYARIHT